MKKPNFFIVGAPKCGTTSIASWLSQHPDIFMTAHKEPHHFNTDMTHRNFPELRDYELLFDSVAEEAAIGEASVWYLYSKDAIANLEQYSKGPRYIVCLRNPVDMAYSLHEQQVFSGNEDQTDFAKAWRLAERRRAGSDIPSRATDASTLIYADACATGTQVERLLSQVDRDRVRFVLMNDLKDKPGEVLNGLLQFLGVSTDDRIELRVENVAKQRKSVIAQRVTQALGRIKRATGFSKSFGLLTRIDIWNRKPHDRVPIDPVLRSALLKHFEAEIMKIEKVLGRPLPEWRS